jgi:large subunit ribosomal protein L18
MLKRKIRHKRIRGKISGTTKRPRLSVFRSSKTIYAQLINDENGKTIVSAKASETKKDKNIEIKLNNKEIEAYNVGKLIAMKGIEVGIKEVVFDKSGYMYHGRVKALANGARDGGLKF